jgi:UDP-2,3-diacylglucosamine hydrolase
VLPAPAYIISDAHLGFAPADVEDSVVGFLEAISDTAGSLVIAGDLFEFWFEWKEVIPRRAFPALKALARVRDSGVPILMLAGNHDCWGGSFLREELGIDYRLEPFVGSIAGWTSRVEHGDGVRPREDRGYRVLRSVIRHPLPRRIFKALPPDFASRIAYGSSHTSRSYKSVDDGAALKAAAGEQLASDARLELVVYGHSHMPALERLGSGIYANAGSWLDAPTFIHLTPERISLRRWDGSVEGSDLHGLDRHAEEPLP